MKTNIVAKSIIAGTLAITLAGCSGMTQRDRNTVGGAAIGGVAGSLLTSGGTLGTLGGAAIGGVIGNQVGGGRHRR